MPSLYTAVMINSYLLAVHEFHQKVTDHHPTKPVLIDETLRSFRIKLMQEELDEVKAAMTAENLPEIAKELTDLLYTVIGTIDTYGLREKFDQIFTEVHRSNMSKDFNAIGKAIKGESYQPANIEEILQ